MKKISKNERIVKKFALFPITIGDESIWLETVYIKEKYEFYMLLRDFIWIKECFVTKKEYEDYKQGGYNHWRR